MIKDFKREFKELLEKYNVGITFQVGEYSDTHGLYDEKLIVYHNVPKSHKTEDWIVVSGWGLDSGDIDV